MLLTAAAAFAQPAGKPFEPFSGQPGKDVVWVPTSQALVDKMLDMAKLRRATSIWISAPATAARVITAATTRRALDGYRIQPDMVELSKTNATRPASPKRRTFVKAICSKPISPRPPSLPCSCARYQSEVRPKILNLKPGTRIVSTPSRWANEGRRDCQRVLKAAGCSYYCTAHLWIVAGKVAWHLAPNPGRFHAEAGIPDGPGFA